jgi:hypothetical protein
LLLAPFLAILLTASLRTLESIVPAIVLNSVISQ